MIERKLPGKAWLMRGVALWWALAGCDSQGSAARAHDAGSDTLEDATASVDAAEAADAARRDDAAVDASDVPLPSTGCESASSYPVGASSGELNYGGVTRSFRVHVPPGYDRATASPSVLMFHGGGGSGRQFEEDSANMDPIADRERFITVYPDGSGLVKTWNGGGCCGPAVEKNVDDVGFVAALLDHLESSLCLDRRRIFASGMSNGGILSHRLACELTERIAAIAPVAGTDMTATCTPARPIAVLHIHGSADGHVPFAGGEGCGPAGVPFTSVPATIERWRARNGCGPTGSLYLEQGDGRCELQVGCSQQADVVLCTVAGGGHNWPGGEPPAGLVACPANGGQSSTFHASEVVWSFFKAHPMPPR